MAGTDLTEGQTPSTPSYPLLSTIKTPADLRKLDIEQLPQICEEIREFLIKEVSQNPGHFASSMGAVELTVALHYVFDTPYDKLVWDVGHQAYGHKLLTGRQEAFSTNRKKGGLSGFPSPKESEYDTFAAGHASNSISAALGMAVAASLKGEKRNVVAIIGDASISGGLAFEGVNNASETPNNLLIVLNDNDMSIDRPVGSLNSYLSHVTTSKAYNNARYKMYRALKKFHLVSESGKRAILRFNNSLKSLFSRQQNIFEGLNIRYLGPFDGHDVVRIVRVLRDIKDMKGPRILHLRTIKGKGYEPAEKNPAIWHAPGLFDPETGERISSSGNSTKYQDVFGKTITALAKKDPKILGITAAMPSGTSLSIMQQELPERVFDVGISEGHAVTFAGGLAEEGMKPFVAIYSSFLQRGYDNIIHDVSLNSLPVTLCIDRAGLVGEDGPTHHGVFDMAYLNPIPNVIISSPSDAQQLRDLIYTAAVTEHGPFAIRYPRGGCEEPDWQKEPQLVEVGKGRKLYSNSDKPKVVVLTIGPIAHQAQEAIKENHDIALAHYDMRFLKPIDIEILKEVAQTGAAIITVEDGAKTGGLGTTVSQWLNDNGYRNHVTILGIPDRFIQHGSVKELWAVSKIDSNSISEAIKEAAAQTK